MRGLAHTMDSMSGRGIVSTYVLVATMVAPVCALAMDDLTMTVSAS